MKEVNDATCCVVDSDSALFLPLARRLAKGFKRVLYHRPSAQGFPTINQRIIGKGFPEIEVVDDMWSIKDDIDCFAFPDINQSDLQLELERQGFSVWGSRKGDSLEIYRVKFHRILGELGLEVPTFAMVEGMQNLREHLKDVEDKYIKISKYRGSLETFHWRSWDMDEGTLDMLSVRFGPAKNIMQFLVFDKIETNLEIGNDTYCVDGQWPSLMLHGDELKDRGYIGAVTRTDDMPDQIKEVLEKFGPILKEYRYRNQFSTELRISGDKFYFLDPCCRGGLPTTSSQLALWSNFPEIVWAGSHGELIDPEPSALFSAECIITAKVDPKIWTVMDIPESLADNALFGGACQIDGKIVQPADESHTGNEVGWLVATGDTIKETIENLHELAEKLPDGVEADTNALVELLKEVAEGEEKGIEFANEKIPEPETALKL